MRPSETLLWFAKDTFVGTFSNRAVVRAKPSPAVGRRDTKKGTEKVPYGIKLVNCKGGLNSRIQPKIPKKIRPPSARGKNHVFYCSFGRFRLILGFFFSKKQQRSFGSAGEGGGGLDCKGGLNSRNSPDSATCRTTDPNHLGGHPPSRDFLETISFSFASILCTYCI